jgi:hypothetical protein
VGNLAPGRGPGARLARLREISRRVRPPVSRRAGRPVAAAVG